MEQTIVKPDTIRTLGPVDIRRLKALVGRVSDTVWQSENEGKENDFFCFHHTQHIIFRFIGGNRDHRDYYSNPIWSMWKNILLPIMDAVVAPYGYTKPAYPKAMLARLAAGHIIDSHVDGAGSNLHTHKIHIPIQTNLGAIFYVNKVPHHLEEGMAYEVNNIVPHAVENFGQTDRIHFIFEVFDDIA